MTCWVTLDLHILGNLRWETWPRNVDMSSRKEKKSDLKNRKHRKECAQQNRHFPRIWSTLEQVKRFIYKRCWSLREIFIWQFLLRSKDCTDNRRSIRLSLSDIHGFQSRMGDVIQLEQTIIIAFHLHHEYRFVLWLSPVTSTVKKNKRFNDICKSVE